MVCLTVFRCILTMVLMAGVVVAGVPASALDKGPVGIDMVKRLDLLPYLYAGGRTMHVSSHDRTGGNTDKDNYMSSSGYTIFDDKGPGCITRMWFTNRWGTEKALLFGTANIWIDGVLVIQTPLTSFPGNGQGANNTITGGLFSGWYSNAFMYPLVGNRDNSSGGFYCYSPIPYRQSCKITVPDYVSTSHAFYYNIEYKEYDTADGITSFTTATDYVAPYLTASELWNNVRLNKEAFDPKQPASPVTYTGTVSVPAGSTTTLRNLTGPSSIASIQLKLAGGVNSNPDYLTKLMMQVSFDGRPADVYCLLGHFFGTDLYWPTQGVAGLLFGVNAASGWNYNYFPMPFGSSASVALKNTTASTVSAEYKITVTGMPDAARLLSTGQIGYFCTTKNTDYLNAVLNQDYTLLDVTGRGKVVGIVYSPQSNNEKQNYLEGDERVYVDGSLSPSIHGTGTEDTFNGGWYMKWGFFTQPSHGYTTRNVGVKNGDGTIAVYDSVSLYRLFIADAIPFNSSLKYRYEFGNTNDLAGCKARYTMFYYLATTPGALSAPSIHDITADPGETSKYDVEYVTSTYTDSGRQLIGGSAAFTMSIQPNNYGVKLRRLMKYTLANQQANVKVDGQSVGTWYDGGYNYSRFWRETDFDIPASFTRGKSSIGVTIEPVGTWNEYKYWAYTYVSPTAAPASPAVTDDGAFTPSRTQLHFTISQPVEPVWGIDDFSYAIGTTSLGTDIRGWTSIGTGTSYTATGLSLQPGVTYYISVKSKNGLGVESAPAASDGIQTHPDPVTLSLAKIAAGNTEVLLNGMVVTAQFNGCCYVRDANGVSGVKVNWPTAVTEGSMVNVLGKIKADASGERYIDADSVW